MNIAKGNLPLRRHRPRTSVLSFALLAGALLPCTSALATSATWLGGSGSWNSTNWSDVGGGTAAPGATSGTTNTDTATFNTSGTNAITVDNNRNLQGITFDTNVGSYTFGTGTLNVTTGGSIQLASTATSSGQTETFSDAVYLEGNGGVTFANNASTTDVLDFTGTITSGGVDTLYLEGSNTGANTISGGIGGGGIPIVKAGSGSWTIAGTNSLGGTNKDVMADGGTLTIDFTNGSSPGSNVLPATARLITGGGTVVFSTDPGTSVTNTQTLAFLAENEGDAELKLNNSGTGTFVLNLNSGYTGSYMSNNYTDATAATTISVNAGGTLDITLGANTVIDYAPVTVTGSNTFSSSQAVGAVLKNGSYLVGTVNGGADWAAESSSNTIIAASNVTTANGYSANFYTTATTTSLGANNGNADMNGGTTTISTKVSPTTIRFNSGGSATIATSGSPSTVYVAPLGILVTSNYGDNIATISGQLEASAFNVLDFDQYDTTTGSDLVISGGINTIASTSGWAKNGGGLLTFQTTSNAIAGPAYLNAGITNIAGDGSLGAVPGTATAGYLVFNGGTLQIGNTANQGSGATIAINSNRGIAVGTNGATIDTNGNGASYGGIIAGSIKVSGIGAPTGTFTKAGSGVLTLSGANITSGGISINAGTLSINSIANGGVQVVTGAGSTSTNTVTVSAAAGASLTTGETLSGQASNITEGTTITAIATGASTDTLTLSANPVATGTVVVNYGTPNALGLSTNASTNLTIGSSAGATLQYTGATGSTDRLFQLNNTSGGLTDSIDASGTGALTFSNTGTITYGTANLAETLNLTGTNTGANTFNPLLQDNGSGKLSVTKTGIGSWTLTGSNTYSGATTVSAGTLEFGVEKSLYNDNTGSWTASNLVVQSGATAAFAVGGTNQFTTGDVTTLLTNLDGSVTTGGLQSGSAIGFDTTNASGSSFTVSNAIANTTGSGGGSVGLTKLGTGTLVLSGGNTYTGATTVNGGTLALSNTGGQTLSGTTAVTVNSGGTLLFGTGNAVNNSATVNLNGGTMSVARTGSSNGTLGLAETVGALTLTSSSTIDFGSGTTEDHNEIIFSSFTATSGTLTINDWLGSKTVPLSADSGSNDELLFGTGNGSYTLSSNQLADIQFNINGITFGALQFNYNGYDEVAAAVPEPSTVFAALCLLGLIGWRSRRRLQQSQSTLMRFGEAYFVSLISSRSPRTGMRNQSGRLFNS